MKRNTQSSVVARLFTVLAILIATLTMLPQSHAETTVEFYNDRVDASVLAFGGMAPILDIKVTSDGARDEVITSFSFATIGGVSKVPVGVDIYIYEQTVPWSIGRFLGKSNFRAGVQMNFDVFLDFFQGLADTRHLTVFAKSRDEANNNLVLGIRPVGVGGNSQVDIRRAEQSMMLTLIPSLKIGTVKWIGGEGNLTAPAERPNQLLGTFDITVQREVVIATDLPLRIDTYGKVDGITQVTLQDEFGNTLAGPVDMEDDGTGRGGYCFFSGQIMLSTGTRTIQVRGTPGKAGYNASIMCSFDARPEAEQAITMQGNTFSYWLTPEAPSIYMQSTRIATPAFRYTVRGVQGTVVSPGKRVLLGHIIINEDVDDSTRFEDILYKSVRLEFTRPIKGLLENLSLRFDGSLQNATVGMNFVSDSEVQLNFANSVFTGRNTRNIRILVEADVAEVGKTQEFTMYVEDEKFVAVGADYGVRANAQSVDSISLTVKIGPPENLFTGGHIQWFSRVAVTPQSDYYLLDIATLEAGRYVVQASQGVDQPWIDVVAFSAQAKSVAKVETPSLVRKQNMFFRVKRLL